MHPATTLRKLDEPRLVTARLVLRPLAEADLDDIVFGIGNWNVARFLSRVPFPYGRRDAEAFLGFARDSAADGSELTLVIDRGGRAIGCMGLAAIGGGDEFGYWLAEPEWNRGYASEAGRAFLAHAFVALGIDRIRSGVFVDNPASLRVQEKLGFVVTGRSMRLSLARGGEVAHIDTMLTRRRFEELR
jgi:RimJ/RimL family protein N-acetyltransferase